MKKSSKSLAAILICFLQILFVHADLIDHECPRTPKPDLCFSSLKPYYRTYEPPSLRELAIVLGSTVLVNEVYATIDKINEIKKELPAYQVLKKCASNFEKIRTMKIRQFRASLVKSDYDAAVVALNDIVSLANRCSSALSKGYSDLIDMCSKVSDISNDAALIVRDIH